MVTRGLWNLHVDGKWYRWFHLPRGQSTSPDSPTTLRTLQQILSRTENFKWDSVPFPTPLHFQLDYVYTIDEDAGHFMLTEWKTANQALHQITRKVALASIRETLQSTIDTLLDDAGELSKHNDHSLSDIRNETNVEYLLNAFGIKPSIPTRLNELQFQLFIDFVYTWRFYFDDNSTWERSFSLLSTLAIGLLRIAAWDLEVRNMDTEELPITFSSLPRWKAPIDEIFWFHKYLIVCCNTDQIGTSVATKAKDFARKIWSPWLRHLIWLKNGTTLPFHKFTALIYKASPSPYRAVANELNQVLLGFTARLAMLGHIWNVQTCRLLCLLALMSLTVLVVKRADLVLLLTQAVFTNSIVQSENGKLAA
ncbi:hypothetical protein APSETT445_006389 [Aspergillus pseudonomiae]